MVVLSPYPEDDPPIATPRKSPSQRRILPPMPADDQWLLQSRTYRASFRSTSPQRLEPVLRGRSTPGGLREGMAAFDRTHARVLGPGSYDPMLPADFQKSDAISRAGSSFRSKRPQRPTNRAFTADIDLAHGDGANNAAHLNSSMFSSSPGSAGNKFSASLRKPPNFHIESKPYPFGVFGDPRHRAAGIDNVYDQERDTMDAKVAGSARAYAASFHTVQPRLSAPGAVNVPAGTLISETYKRTHLGPGGYKLPAGVTCSVVVREPFRSSSVFAPRVGGKFAHVMH